MELEELYQQILFDHARNSRHRGEPSPESHSVELRNPLCGDVVRFSLDIMDDVVTRARFDGSGCMISMAAASILAQALEGKPITQAADLLATFRSVLKGERSLAESFPDVTEFQALEGVKNFPVRIKCALLPFDTAEQALVCPRKPAPE